MAAPRYFEAFQVGETVTSRSWKIETSDVRIFFGCSSLAGRLFTDELYCKKYEKIQKPLIPSSLLLNIIDTFFAIHVSPATIPTLHYGYDKSALFEAGISGGQCLFCVYSDKDKSEE